MYNYQFCTKTISSEFKIPYLLSTEPPALNINLTLGNISKPPIKPYYSWLNQDLTPRLNFYNLNQEYYLEYPNLITFKISNQNIQCEPIISEEYHYLHLLTDQIIPLYLSLKHLVLHASGYAYNKHNVILSGKSGAGKSTLIKNLYSLGGLIGDDFIVFDQSKKPTQVCPSYPGIRLLNNQEFKEVYPVSKIHFHSSSQTNQNIIICLNRDLSFPVNQYQLTEPSTEEVYQQLLTAVIQLTPNEPSRQLILFSELNNLIKESRILKLSYSDLSQVDFNLLNEDFFN